MGFKVRGPRVSDDLKLAVLRQLPDSKSPRRAISTFYDAVVTDYGQVGQETVSRCLRVLAMAGLADPHRGTNTAQVKWKRSSGGDGIVRVND